MTKIKLCGMMRAEDIETANELAPEYVGFVFAKKSRRYVEPEQAAAFRRMLNPSIQAVGVFVDEAPERVAQLLGEGIIDIAQLHGGEDEAYVRSLRALTDKPIIKAFRIDCERDVAAANASSADCVLLDSGSGGTGTCFDWRLLSGVEREYFLAGGLSPENAAQAVRALRPYAADVSSGIETNGLKDADRMRAFVRAVRSI